MVAHRIQITIVYLFFSVLLGAQDTIRTLYPNTQQSWEKVFLDGQKVSENVYHENGTTWMTFQYEADKTEKYKWFHV